MIFINVLHYDKSSDKGNTVRLMWIVFYSYTYDNNTVNAYAKTSTNSNA